MWPDHNIQRLVRSFWQRCGEEEPFPRALERSIALGLPIAVVKLPRLTISSIEFWLRDRGVRYSFSYVDRGLRGCLLAWRGRGIIFLDGTDPTDQVRFTVAHEVAHFLDYLDSLDAAARHCGERIGEVIEGARPPSVAERLSATLAGVDLGVYMKLMERDYLTGDLAGDSIRLENRADAIAVALLAPPAEVLGHLDRTLTGFAQRLANCEGVLERAFGLPSTIARRYARKLIRRNGRGDSMAQSLRDALGSSPPHRG
jgi:hypothetical protein